MTSDRVGTGKPNCNATDRAHWNAHIRFIRVLADCGKPLEDQIGSTARL